jgi:hypothetical protein
LDDSPNSVDSPRQGDTFVGSVWVKADTAAGKPVQVVIRANGGSTASENTASSPLTLTTGWQQVQVRHTVVRADRTSLELYVAQTDAASGDAFFVDSITLVKQ